MIQHCPDIPGHAYVIIRLCAVSYTHLDVYKRQISFSASSAVAAGEVGLIPVDFTLDSYKYMADKPEFWKSLTVSLGRILLAVDVYKRQRLWRLGL